MRIMTSVSQWITHMRWHSHGRKFMLPRQLDCLYSVTPLKHTCQSRSSFAVKIVLFTFSLGDYITSGSRGNSANIHRGVKWMQVKGTLSVTWQIPFQYMDKCSARNPKTLIILPPDRRLLNRPIDLLIEKFLLNKYARIVRNSEQSKSYAENIINGSSPIDEWFPKLQDSRKTNLDVLLLYYIRILWKPLDLSIFILFTYWDFGSPGINFSDCTKHQNMGFK